MPRQIEDENNSPYTSYEPFFEPSYNTLNQYISEIERNKALERALIDLKHYEEQIKNHQETKESIQRLLNKGNLSPSAREKATDTLKSVEADLEYHQTKLAALIEHCPRLQPHFSPQPKGP